LTKFFVVTPKTPRSMTLACTRHLIVAFDVPLTQKQLGVRPASAYARLAQRPVSHADESTCRLRGAPPGIVCLFEEDLKTSLARQVKLTDSNKLIEIADRGSGLPWSHNAGNAPCVASKFDKDALPASPSSSNAKTPETVPVETAQLQPGKD
jgi:hypothetical protein